MKYLLLVAAFIFCFTKISHSQKLEIEKSDSIYYVVNKKPYLKGKKNKLDKELRKVLNYPDQIKLQGVEGVVLTECIITKEGVIESINVVKSLHPDLDKEAILAIQKLGIWIPAKVDGNFVSSYMTIPVKFLLSDDDKEILKVLSKIDFKNRPPLFILDGNILNKTMVIEPYDIRSIRVIKGQKAIDKYGDKAKFGVVEMKSKSGSSYLK